MNVQTTEEKLRRTEVTLGVKFPNEFKKKIMGCDGGMFSDYFGNEWDMMTFKDSENNIIKELESAQKWESFNEDLIPIAIDMFGDYVVFLRSYDKTKVYSTLYHWVHDDGSVIPMYPSFDYIKLIKR